MSLVLLRGVLLGAGAWACTLASAQPLSCAVVLLHGKWGTAQSPYLKPVAQKIEPHCQVRLLEMPWSRHRLYDRPYADALAHIQATVQTLRQSGIQWVAVGGQSFGANAALAYMAQVGDVDAVLPMAPGHVPEVFDQVPDVRSSVDAARQSVQSGQGDTLVEMNDINQGQRRPIKTTATALWSYFNPQGWGNMGLSAAAFRKPVPVFWAIGKQDTLYPTASAAIYQKLPPHPDSRYLVLNANHANTPELAADEAVQWLLSRTGR